MTQCEHCQSLACCVFATECFPSSSKESLSIQEAIQKKFTGSCNGSISDTNNYVVVVKFKIRRI